LVGIVHINVSLAERDGKAQTIESVEDMDRFATFGSVEEAAVIEALLIMGNPSKNDWASPIVVTRLKCPVTLLQDDDVGVAVEIGIYFTHIVFGE
jgi:hypothetical protein